MIRAELNAISKKPHPPQVGGEASEALALRKRGLAFGLRLAQQLCPHPSSV